MDLYAKAAELGLQTDFIDGYGHPHRIDPQALSHVLEALPSPPARQLIASVPVVRSGETGSTPLMGQAAIPATWSVSAADQVIAVGTSDAYQIVWPTHLPSGVYDAQVTDARQRREHAPLIVAPPSCFAGDFGRSWLIAVQLYSVHSNRNWGIGDFTDLEALIRFAAEVGADGIGLNPLHALFDDRPGDCSPYSPNSRQFLNPLYIDVAKLAGVVLTPDDSAELVRLRDESFVDYPAVAELKMRALRAAYAAHRTGSDSDFEAFRAERGATLTRFACFETLRHARKTPWWVWDDWQSADAAQVAELSAGPHAEDIAFIEFVQWIADRQLRACSDLAKRLGLRVGLYLDIAVGVQSDGFDAWDEQSAISRQLGVGAPPDPMNTAGQSWGLAGFNAAGLEARGFAPYRDMLRASMRYAGAVRLDHVLGLKRLYLVPHGFPPKEGVYVQMPFEALLAVTALESVANRCVVIGEDLGTVPDGFRDALALWGLWSYRVMMFEQDYHSKAFFRPEQYPANALVTFNTHDIATYAGWRSFADLALKRSIGLDPGESDEARWQALAALDRVLRDSDISGDGLDAVVTFLARTPSRLLAVSLEDLLGVIEQPNIPGTVNEHPNWRRRLPAAIEEFAHAIDVAAIERATAERRHADASH
jgi:4-alpha-glucanotransferase